MHLSDQEKTTFVTYTRLYCYKLMLFALKMQEKLTNVSSKNVLRTAPQDDGIYIDDMLVKSLQKDDHIPHLIECFGVLRKHDMKLNPTKRSFTATTK